MIIEPGTRWRRKRDGQEVTVIATNGMHSVLYKAVKARADASHAATAEKRRHYFEKEFTPVLTVAEEPPTIYQPSTDSFEPIATTTSLNTALSAIASDLNVRARSLMENHNELDEVRASTLYEVANAITEYVDGRTIDRALFLSWNVDMLLRHLGLVASTTEARSAIVDGLVYIDGEQVTDSDAPITRVARDRFAIRCGDLSKIVKVVG